MTETTSTRPAPSPAKGPGNEFKMRDGLLLVDKHAGCTSHDIVASARKILRQKKIGHCGTLDPAATGLLLLTVGRATRLTRFLIRAPKVYLGAARLGIVTDTYDTTGETVAENKVEGVSVDKIRSTMSTFVGSYLQAPPAYSAKKVGGVKLYEMARRGEEVPEIRKEVTVYDFHMTEDWADGKDVEFQLGCSSGTYARSLAHELGEALGCGAALSALRRTKIGAFTIDDAVTLEALREAKDAGGPIAAWIPFDEIPLPFGEITTDVQQERRIQHGQTVMARNIDGDEGDWVKIMNEQRRLIAVGAVVERIGNGNMGVIQPKVVFT